MLTLFLVALLEHHGSHIPRWDGVAISILFWGGVLGFMGFRLYRRRQRLG